MKKITLLLCADDGHAAFAGSVIRSAVESSGSDEIIEAYVLSLALSPENVKCFRELETDLEININLEVVPVRWVETLPDKGLTKTPYLRMFAGDLLPEVKQVIYLDTDVLVRSSLAPILLQLHPISGCAAARDPAVITGWGGLQREVPEGFDKSNYFNSGVMALSLDYLREVNAARTLVEIREKIESSVLHDQSAFNIFFGGNISLLPYRYNYINQVYDRIVERGLPGASQLVSCYDDPAIVHFSHYRKPWLRNYPQRFARDFRHHLRNTPWGDNVLPAMTPRKQVARAARGINFSFGRARWSVNKTLSYLIKS